MKMFRRATLALFAAGLMATPAMAKDPLINAPVSGHIVINAKGAAAGVGYTWGDGVLTYKGKNHPFTVNGISVADVGFSQIHGNGRVYHLNKLSDFSGTYAASTGEATVGHGIAGQILENANGVQIRLDDVTKGVRLQGSADGIKLTLK